MMPDVRRWLLGIVLTAFAGGLARQLAPKGQEQALMRLVCGLLLTLAILQPLAVMEWPEAEIGWDAGKTGWRETAEAYRHGTQDALSAVIAEKTEAYIWDKADRLGLQYTIQVSTAAGESGIPLPDTVTIWGSYSAALAAWIEEEVGVPPEKQIWLEEQTWTGERPQSP